METINSKVNDNKLTIKKLKNQEQKYLTEIVNDALLIELLMIYFNSLTLILNNEVKSELIQNYLLLSRNYFNEQFELVRDKTKVLKLMGPNKNQRFKKALNEETPFVQTLVYNLNKIFIIQYDRYSWWTFNDFYEINDDDFKVISKNVQAVLNQARKVKWKVGHLASFELEPKIDLGKTAFLPLKEKTVPLVPLFLYPAKK